MSAKRVGGRETRPEHVFVGEAAEAEGDNTGVAAESKAAGREAGGTGAESLAA